MVSKYFSYKQCKTDYQPKCKMKCWLVTEDICLANGSVINYFCLDLKLKICLRRQRFLTFNLVICIPFPPEFNCSVWDTIIAIDLAMLGKVGVIGENGRKCRVVQGSENQTCNWYVNYDIDGNSTDDWLGLTFRGDPGGTGCCYSENACSTIEGAGYWLKFNHRDICCGEPLHPEAGNIIKTVQL